MVGHVVGNWWHDIFYLVTYVIADETRFTRFFRIALFVGLVLAGWWLLAGGGWQVIMHDFGTANIPRPCHSPG